jgi:hypothetical protein
MLLDDLIAVWPPWRASAREVADTNARWAFGSGPCPDRDRRMVVKADEPGSRCTAAGEAIRRRLDGLA